MLSIRYIHSLIKIESTFHVYDMVSYSLVSKLWTTEQSHNIIVICLWQNYWIKAIIISRFAVLQVPTTYSSFVRMQCTHCLARLYCMTLLWRYSRHRLGITRLWILHRYRRYSAELLCSALWCSVVYKCKLTEKYLQLQHFLSLGNSWEIEVVSAFLSLPSVTTYIEIWGRPMIGSLEGYSEKGNYYITTQQAAV